MWLQYAEYDGRKKEACAAVSHIDIGGSRLHRCAPLLQTTSRSELQLEFYLVLELSGASASVVGNGY